MLRGGASRKVGGRAVPGWKNLRPLGVLCVDLWEQRHGPPPLGQVPKPALCDSMAGALRALLRAPPGRVGRWVGVWRVARRARVAAVGAEWEGDSATLPGFEHARLQLRS